MYRQSEKKIVKQQYLLHMSAQYGELRPTSGWDCFWSLGHHSYFQRLPRLGSVTARQSSSERQPNFAALNRGRRLCSAGRPSRWALAHISSKSIKRDVSFSQGIVSTLFRWGEHVFHLCVKMLFLFRAVQKLYKIKRVLPELWSENTATFFTKQCIYTRMHIKLTTAQQNVNTWSYPQQLHTNYKFKSRQIFTYKFTYCSFLHQHMNAGSHRHRYRHRRSVHMIHLCSWIVLQDMLQIPSSTISFYIYVIYRMLNIPLLHLQKCCTASMQSSKFHCSYRTQ